MIRFPLSLEEEEDEERSICTRASVIRSPRGPIGMFVLLIRAAHVTWRGV